MGRGFPADSTWNQLSNSASVSLMLRSLLFASCSSAVWPPRWTATPWLMYHTLFGLVASTQKIKRIYIFCLFVGFYNDDCSAILYIPYTWNIIFVVIDECIYYLEYQHLGKYKEIITISHNTWFIFRIPIEWVQQYSHYGFRSPSAISKMPCDTNYNFGEHYYASSQLL